MTDLAKSQGKVRLYPAYRTRLGDAMFPANDAFTSQLRSQFSEMLYQHLEAGRPHSAIAIGQSLSEFTPTSVAETEGDWKVRLQEKWEKEQRPLIFVALEEFFIDGGHEARVKTQKDFVAALVDAGVQIEGESELLEELAYSGDWHDAFAQLTLKGRPMGIRLTASSGCDRTRMAQAATGAGFQTDQFARIASGI